MIRTIFFTPTYLNPGGMRESWQWQPITVSPDASHDPNPPLTIEDFVTPPAATNIPLKCLTGWGV